MDKKIKKQISKQIILKGRVAIEGEKDRYGQKYERADSKSKLFSINKLSHNTPIKCGNCDYRDILGAFNLYTETSLWNETQENPNFNFSKITCPKCESQLLYTV